MRPFCCIGVRIRHKFIIFLRLPHPLNGRLTGQGAAAIVIGIVWVAEIKRQKQAMEGVSLLST
jgi:hypothetical protein